MSKNPEIVIEEMRGTEGMYIWRDNQIALGNWSKPFNCPYAESGHFSQDHDLDRVLHVLNHEYLHVLIHSFEGHNISLGLDRLIAYVRTETWEGTPI